MNIGDLSRENTKFMSVYKKIGFPTKTKLIDEAITLLRQKMEKQQREEALKKAAAQYDATPFWQDLEDEDFAG